ncbi:ABC transporter ATP-binding protein [Tenggerimyces flavus]|uniref:ABC transporter ATP-binding protein n=1 Tax=Tenggerimyces flavus TaxID=1708749 RepID=A0ABV7YQ35_9ACTN|nr:ATP-binding cassette domain-containing protein [Tenggerimyces flavus]MBM7790130.1 peptide/nickel transport system ATP-binding protein [Tenggerimyces flavus]
MTALAEITDLVIVPDDGTGAPVVDHVSLSVDEGEVVGVVGRSGSGKTTTALSLFGRVRPGLTMRTGRVRVAGADPFGRGSRAWRHTLSYLAQDPMSALNPARRVGALLAEMLRLRASSTADATRLLAAVDLPTGREFLRRRPWQVSGGQAQRVALALALAGSPRLLVLDEPTSGLDTIVAAEVRAVLARALAATGSAALLISHDARLVAELAHRSVRLEAGHIAEPGTSRTVLAERPPLAVPSIDSRPARLPQLVVEGLTATYARRTVVDGVSFTIPVGGCLALVGPSGSGKTTTARCLVGLHRSTVGSIRLAGQDLAPSLRARSHAQRRSTALVTQDPLGALNPKERVGTALRRPMRDLNDLDAAAHTAALLAQVQLESVLSERLPGSLSGGERQRISIARALAADPELLVCDEITSGLDEDTATAVLDLLSELRRQRGLTVLLITHDLGVAARYADHVLVLSRGRAVELGPVLTVLRSPRHEVTRRLVRASSTIPAWPD